MLRMTPIGALLMLALGGLLAACEGGRQMVEAPVTGARDYQPAALPGRSPGDPDGGGPDAPRFAEPSPGLSPYQRVAAPLDTPWTDAVSAERPWPQYPRPQLVRQDWMNLNGQWQYSTLDGPVGTIPAGPVFVPPTAAGVPPIGRQLEETILVPFPITAPLSGIARNDVSAWYRREFTAPADWSDQRVILNFGAVTHLATVWVNGVEVGQHAGSYDAFSFDITEELNFGAANELIVGIFDPQNGGGQPMGKQSPVSFAIFFSPSPGIWQTVWLEPVGPAHITAMDQTPDVAAQVLRVVAEVDGAAAGDVLRFTARDGSRVIGTAEGAPGDSIAVPVPQPKLWSPDSPYLYDLDVALLRGGEVIDTVDSYFGMRSVAIEPVDGVSRMTLNGDFTFQVGTLDHGYWPDGIYAAPVDAALRFDLEATRDLGFNVNRKHVKVEPQRWYYWADVLGVLVWQDMPNPYVFGFPEAAEQVQFEIELAQMIDEYRSHPSIIVWVPFNEGWGEFDVARVTGEVEAMDPSRLVIGNSGSANCCAAVEPDNGHIRDSHLYNGPWAPDPDHRASVTGEFGVCFGFPEAEHTWTGPAFGNNEGGGDINHAAMRGLIDRQWQALNEQLRVPGLSGAIHVELYDVEREFGGFLTYDRKAERCSHTLLRRLNRELIAASRDPAQRQPRAPAIPPGQIAWWPFDEGEGLMANNRLGETHPLTLSGGAGWTDGVRGSALAAGPLRQQAVAAGPVLDTEQSFTVAAWLRLNVTNQTASAVSQGAAGSAPVFSLGVFDGETRPELFFDPDRLPVVGGDQQYPNWRWDFVVTDDSSCRPRGQCGARASSSYGDGDMPPPAGQWQHVVGVMDREALTLGVFINGRPISHANQSGALAASGVFAVGGGPQLEDNFNGDIDELRVWNRALSAREVAELYAAESEAVR